MKSNFRLRLLFSHILPILIIVPILGLAVLFILENQVIIPTLANEMVNQGLLVARLTADDAQVWSSTEKAQALLDSINLPRPTRIGLLAGDHTLLATSRPDDRSLVGKIITNLPATDSLTNNWWGITAGDLPDERILDVLIPIKSEGGEAIDLVWVYRRMTDIDQSLSNVRMLILGIFLTGLLLSGALAVLLSESFSRPLRRITRTIAEAAPEGEGQPLLEKGNDLFEGLVLAYNHLQIQRRELEENRQRMVANVVHEIGRPLGSLRTAIDALQGGAAEDPAIRADLLKGMSERVDRMGRLLEDLTLIYRRLKPQEIHIKPVMIGKWIGSLIPLWAETSRQKGVQWEFEMENYPFQITTDPERLAQALSNLVNNAIKFTPAGGKVGLAIRQEQSQVLFRVKDTGPGIALEDQPRLFTPFYRTVQPSWKEPGLGLGLSIARSIIESLGGDISFESAPGQGSIFTIHLPL